MIQNSTFWYDMIQSEYEMVRYYIHYIIDCSVDVILFNAHNYTYYSTYFIYKITTLTGQSLLLDLSYLYTRKLTVD